jgi:glycosyltransferase involved in cell wall biosynthesis
VRVLIVAPYGFLGGAELSLLAALERRPADVDPRVLLVADGPLRERLAEAGIPVWLARGYDGPPDPRALGRFTRSLAALLGEWRPDVVWALGQKGALLAAPACRLGGVPVVWHKVDLSWDRELAVPLAAATSGVIAVSEGAARALGPLRSRVLAIAPPPVTLDPDLRAPLAGPPTLGMLARGAPYKGHRELLRAAALLSGEFPDLRVLASCVPVPEYPGYRGELLALVAELRLNAELPEWLAPEEALPRLSVLVSATHRDEQGFGFEGFGLTIVEASWAGVPVVVAEGGGAAEALIDGHTGRLVPDADPATLAAAIAPYLRDPELRARTGEAGRAFARERFAPEVVIPRLFAALEEAAR